MAVCLILKFTGIGRPEYEAVNTKLGIDFNTGAGDWPAGMTSHAAGIADDGSFNVVEIWESREAQGRFMQGRLGRALQEAGVTAVPQLTWIELFAYQTPGS